MDGLDLAADPAPGGPPAGGSGLAPRAAGVDLRRAFDAARREADGLPVLRQGQASRRLLRTWEGVDLVLREALWEVAARSGVPVAPGVPIASLARLLVGYGALVPPAGDAVRVVAAAVDAGRAGRLPAAGPTVEEGARVAERLAGYLRLRARFG